MNTRTFPRGFRLRIACALLAALFVAGAAHGSVRLKDMARIDVGGDLQLIGYGLVVGLDGTGDSKSSIFTMQSIANMLTRLGVTVPESKIRSRNAASVMVVTKLNRFHRKGSTVDVTLSSIGDASSLEGGTLLHTPIATPDGFVYASAQGPVSVGGFSVKGSGSDKVGQNYVLVGRVPGGAIVEREWEPDVDEEQITILLYDPDFTTAKRVAEAINGEMGGERATALDAATVVIDPTDEETVEERVALLSRIELVEVQPDAAARIVVNERTGTIVAGQHVTISAVAIAHGNLSVEIRGRPFVSQPTSFSQGETVLFEDSQVTVGEENSALTPLEEAANVGDLARALNALGVSPRDMIAIFQALKEAGALRAELRII
ncbi:MAG: flagellar basal body P-ring protein FlgI [Candidatus Eisenbacteria bacterium]|nr:flagellar basal body P-ring protein FlgI [Candidatus Eisenbacteria bacterium]